MANKKEKQANTQAKGQATEQVTEKQANTEATEQVETKPKKTPAEITLKQDRIILPVGSKAIIDFTSNAKVFNYKVTNPDCISVNKISKTIKALKVGNSTIEIEASGINFEPKKVVLNIVVEEAPEVDNRNFNVTLENTYHYDETLPLSVNGTICYKSGVSDDMPLIKLCFNGERQQWDIIGVRITRYNKSNEPYELYFLASEGEVDSYLNNLNLDGIVLELVKKCFEDDKPNSINKLNELFTETIEPLIKNKLNDIPKVMDQLTSENLKKIVNELLKDKLNETFNDLIVAKINEEASKYEYHISAPRKKDDVPKWVGYMYMSENLLYGKEKGEMQCKRLNTNGIEEYWMGSFQSRINEHRNDDALTKLFDKIEPFKSMERLEFLLEDLSNLKNKEIYSKETYEKIRKSHYERFKHHFNGDFISGFSDAELFERPSAWVVPMKKCHYIDVEIIVNTDEVLSEEELKKRKNKPTTTYYLKAVGEEAFSIDLKQYFPHAASFTIRAFLEPRVGYFSFIPKTESIQHKNNENPNIMGTTKGKLKSNMHPAFFDFYDDGLQLIPEANVEKPSDNLQVLLETQALPYIYFGAFLGTNCNVTEHSRGLNKINWQVLPKPGRDHYTEHYWWTTFSEPQNRLFQTYGDNSPKGINFKHMNIYYYHILTLLEEIERGSPVINRYSQPYRDYKWGFIEGHDVKHRLWGGSTWHLHNKTGKAMTHGWMSNTYRGVENPNSFYSYLDLWEHRGDASVWMHRPCTHRKIVQHFAYDNLHWVNTHFVIPSIRAWNNQHQTRPFANSVGLTIYESQRHFYDYTINCDYRGHAILIRGFHQFGSGWHLWPLTHTTSNDNVWWGIVCRPCI